jgi:hypothetical protein
MADAPPRTRSLTLTRRLVLVLAVGLHLATGFFYLAAGLVAPLWGVLLLWAAWIGLMWLLVRLWRQHAVLALLVPPASIGLFVGVLSAGDAWLGWVA